MQKPKPTRKTLTAALHMHLPSPSVGTTAFKPPLLPKTGLGRCSVRKDHTALKEQSRSPLTPAEIPGPLNPLHLSPWQPHTSDASMHHLSSSNIISESSTAISRIREGSGGAISQAHYGSQGELGMENAIKALPRCHAACSTK